MIPDTFLRVEPFEVEAFEIETFEGASLTNLIKVFFVLLKTCDVI